MRAMIILNFIFISTFSFGQIPSLESKYNSDVCACIDSLKDINLNEQALGDCFQKAMQQNADLIIKQIKQKYGDTSEESGYKFGQELAGQAVISLVATCKTYFVLTDSLRYEDYKNLNQDSLKLELSKMDNVQSANKNDEYFANKSLLFFELKQYDSALSEVKNSLELNANNSESLYIKAWINEIKRNYDEAIALYNKVAEITKNKNFYIFSEVAKRKKNGM